MNVTERAAYVKGLAEGLELDANSKEGKIINALITALEEMATTVSDLEDEVEYLSDKVDEIDADLGEVEEFLLDEEGFYGCGDDDDECDCGCGGHGDIYEVCCPTCGDTVCVDSDMLQEGSIKCPNCGELLEFDFTEISEEQPEE